MARAKSNTPPEKNRALLAQALLDLVNDMHRTKNIPKEVIFSGIESAVQAATARATATEDVEVHLDRDTGELTAMRDGVSIDPEVLGRIAAQSAKQLIIQKIREAEGDSLYNEYLRMRGKLITGTVQRVDAGTAIVSLSAKAEALLPRSEQIPGESQHISNRVKAIIMEVKRQGHRVKIVLSRCHPDFVRGLFEEAIPEVSDRTIDIRAVAREAGYRSKVAVSSIDLKVDCVGACVGVRGSRIKTITEELNGERIDIVRWNDSLQVLIPNALQPASIEEVFTYPRLGRAIVLVNEDQLSLAIGRRGQNVRLASKLVGWDIEIMTHEELGNGLAKAEHYFRKVPHLNDDMINALIEEGFLSYTDLTFMEPEQIMEITDLDENQVDDVIAFAEEMSEKFEREGEPEFVMPTDEIAEEAGEATEAVAEDAEATEVSDLEATEEELSETELPDAIAEELLDDETMVATLSGTSEEPGYEELNNENSMGETVEEQLEELVDDTTTVSEPVEVDESEMEEMSPSADTPTTDELSTEQEDEHPAAN